MEIFRFLLLLTLITQQCSVIWGIVELSTIISQRGRKKQNERVFVSLPEYRLLFSMGFIGECCWFHRNFFCMIMCHWVKLYFIPYIQAFIHPFIYSSCIHVFIYLFFSFIHLFIHMVVNYMKEKQNFGFV